ncbi:MAG TPA: AMP-binding protein [Chitinophagales bacterium]|nr:AMP-binding protein [Chitinophagales bacterium]
MADRIIHSPLSTFYKWEKQQADTMYLRQPINGEWHTYTWKQCGEQVRRMAAYLQSLNYPPGSRIAILSKNCVHWMLSDYAIWMAGHISVPMYPNMAPTTVKQILEHSESKLLFVGKLDDWAYLKPGVPEGLPCIAFPFYGITEYTNWDTIIERTAPITDDPDYPMDNLCTIMYTSGTTGMPKGVMHTFYNFAYAAEQAFPLLNIDNRAIFFSYLPMCHIAERLLIEMGSLYTGGKVSFAESLDTFPKNLQDTSPTIFLAVPRIWAKFQEKILEKMPQKKLNTLLSIPIISGIVKKKIRKALGLSNADQVFSGAAPISTDLIKWFWKLDIKIQQAYAMTEDCCYSHTNYKDRNKIGTVGLRFPGVDLKFTEQGEMLVKHPAMMKGYYKEEAMTREVFTEDGYFKTGDKAEVDAEGFLKITGRVKELFKTSKGKYVAPMPIELKFSANPDVGQVLVVGYTLPQPIAIITLSENGKKKDTTQLNHELLNTLNAINNTLDSFEKLEKIVVMQEEWTIQNNLLTPSMKIKRNEVEKKFQDMYEKWYEMKEVVIWE